MHHMGSFRTVYVGVATCLFAFLLFSGGGIISAQLIQSSVPNGEMVCPGQEINYTCETRGSQTLAWASDEYIEADGSRLDFATFNTVGDTRTSPVNQNTVATLINNTNENGEVVLESQLRIVVSPQIATFTIICSIDDGTGRNISLQLLGDVGTPQDLTVILSNDTTTRSCEVQLGWTAHSDIFYYTVFINGENISEVINNGNQSLILRSYPVCNCAVRQVSVIGVDRCGQQGQTALTTIIQLDQESIPPPTCETETTTQSTIFRNDENKYRMATIALGVLFIIPLAIIVVLVITMICILRRLQKIKDEYNEMPWYSKILCAWKGST